ncbi:hypothetical protein [Neobacillus sp. PS3-40]|uniref:hypothetical protein n=1 Tax=Neobacillus sp. PS3-40 TaxID=3070679 RepID=UPI0027DEB4E7|nr:hypothetical protein [Neobacillus sp. PS3-40]WML44880.1 hypothetical protein RCG20_02945 [Neobacillus sp. PS3-40]
MKLYSNMEFEMKSTFLPNISNSDTLKITEITPKSVVILMHNSNCRGVFPIDNFQYWIKKNSLVHIIENEVKTS